MKTKKMTVVIKRRASIVITSDFIEQSFVREVRITPKRVYVGSAYPEKYDRFTGNCLDKFRSNRKGATLLRIVDGEDIVLETEANKKPINN